MALHLSLVILFALTQINFFFNHKQKVNFEIYIDPVVAQLSKPLNLKPVQEIEKQPELTARKVFGANRKSIQTKDKSEISVKSGNTLAKENDSLSLNKDDLDSLPIPVADYLITDEPSIIFEPKNKQRTDEARKNGYTGIAILKILVDETGIVREVKLVNSLKYGLNERAIELAKQIKLSPAKINGKPVAVIRDFTINFKSND